MIKKVQQKFKWSSNTERGRIDKNCDSNNNKQTTLDKTLFIDGCDCGVLAELTTRPKNDPCCSQKILQLTANNNNNNNTNNNNTNSTIISYNNNNNNNNNNGKCIFEHVNEDDDEVLYKDDCFVETSNSSSCTDINHDYECLEEEYSTMNNDEYVFDDHAYETVN